jgi:hypothetical protein
MNYNSIPEFSKENICKFYYGCPIRFCLIRGLRGIEKRCLIIEMEIYKESCLQIQESTEENNEQLINDG